MKVFVVILMFLAVASAGGDAYFHEPSIYHVVPKVSYGGIPAGYGGNFGVSNGGAYWAGKPLGHVRSFGGGYDGYGGNALGGLGGFGSAGYSGWVPNSARGYGGLGGYGAYGTSYHGSSGWWK